MSGAADPGRPPGGSGSSREAGPRDRGSPPPSPEGDPEAAGPPQDPGTRLALGAARLLLSGAILLVPPRARERWREEWLAELRHAAGRHRAGAILARAAGSVVDGLALRREVRRHASPGPSPWDGGRRRPAADVRSPDPLSTMDAIVRDFRQALRSLLRTPGFTAASVVTLTLGIGATAAIFTLLDSVVLRPLPYPESHRLVSITHPVPGLNSEWEWGLSRAGYLHFSENARKLDVVAVHEVYRMNFAGEEGAQRATVARITPDVFDLLGARPAAGRLLVSDDARPDAPPVAVLDHDFWRSRFGGDPSVVGTTVRIEGVEMEAVGVTAPGVELPDRDVDVWIPQRIDDEPPFRNWHRFTAMARLAPGATLGEARTELARLTDGLPERYPGAYGEGFVEESRFSVRVLRLRERVVGSADELLWILLGSVALVLAIACANVANLFLVRLEGRRREHAVRAALGAGRGRLARHFLAETLSVCLVAGAAGLGVAHGGVRLVQALGPDSLPRLAAASLGPRSILFTLGIAGLGGLLLGAIPLLRRSGVDPRALHEGGGRTTGSKGASRARRLLVAGQVALALVLLAAGGLMVQTFRNLRAVDPGLDTREVVAADLNLPSAGYRDYAATTAYHRELLRRVGALPGVERGAFTTDLPLDGYGGCAAIFVRDDAGKGEEPPCVNADLVSPGYFRAMGIPVRGRTPRWSDVDAGTGAVVVTRALADRLWPGEEALGKMLRPNGWAEAEDAYYRVVGVTGEIRAAGLDEPPVETVFFPLRPIEGAPLWSPPREGSLVVRASAGSAGALAGSLRRTVAGLDRNVAFSGVRSMERVLEDDTADAAFTATLLLLAALMAVVLSAVGLYGVVSYSVGRRRGEIGIRMAMGARMGEIVSMVVGRSLKIAGGGAFAGLGAAFVLTRLLRSILFEVEPTDPVVLATVTLLVFAVAGVASWIPARRAARVDPSSALRAE